jgi:hypothetical protein
MPKNKIEDMRNLLFDTMERLLDDDNPMDVPTAQAVANVAKVMVDSAKAEIEFMKHVGGLGSGFIPSEPKRLESENA